MNRLINAAISAGAGAMGAAAVFGVATLIDTNRMVADALSEAAQLRVYVANATAESARELGRLAGQVEELRRRIDRPPQVQPSSQQPSGSPSLQGTLERLRLQQPDRPRE